MSELIVYVSIGNSDDKLTQIEWSELWTGVNDDIEYHAEQIIGIWLSKPETPYQNACWAFSIATNQVDSLKRRLSELAFDYQQDEIAWAIADTKFIKPLKIKEA